VIVSPPGPNVGGGTCPPCPIGIDAHGYMLKVLTLTRFRAPSVSLNVSLIDTIYLVTYIAVIELNDCKVCF